MSATVHVGVNVRCEADKLIGSNLLFKCSLKCFRGKYFRRQLHKRFENNDLTHFQNRHKFNISNELISTSIHECNEALTLIPLNGCGKLPVATSQKIIYRFRSFRFFSVDRFNVLL